MARVALKVIENPFSKREVELWNETSGKTVHSLHHAIAVPDALRPEIPSYFINKYAPPKGVVLDPFCGAGAVALEASTLGRIMLASDSNPYYARLTKAKLEPADLTEVTLRLQKVNFRKPISLDIYHQAFSSFYSLDTFREICNLRAHLLENPDRVSRFIELLTLGLLHGHKTGFLSVYTFPQVSVSPEEQEVINGRRGNYPDYRAVLARLLRKTAMVLRDGNGSLYRENFANHVEVSDARNLAHVGTGSVDLVMTAPPLYGRTLNGSQEWLRHWFSGISSRSLPKVSFPVLENWVDYMNEVLVELARVVKSNGRAVLVLREVTVQGGSIILDDVLHQMIAANLSRFWEAEGVVVQKQKPEQIRNSLKPRAESKASHRERVLILRRR